VACRCTTSSSSRSSCYSKVIGPISVSPSRYHPMSCASVHARCDDGEARTRSPCKATAAAWGPRFRQKGTRNWTDSASSAALMRFFVAVTLWALVWAEYPKPYVKPMDAETLKALIPAAAAIMGALIGGFSAYLVARANISGQRQTARDNA